MAITFESKFPLLALILVTLVTLVVYFKSRKSSTRIKNLAPGSLGFPLLGESLSFFKAQKEDKVVEWVADRVARYGPVFKTSLMFSKMVVITGQAGNKFIFGGGDTGLASNQTTSASNILGKRSIFEVSGLRHKAVRGTLMSFLKPEALQRFVGQMDSLVKQQLFEVHELESKDSVQAVTLIKTITFTVTCNLLIGLREGKEKNELYDDFITAMRGVWALPVEYPGSTYSKAIKARARIRNQISCLLTKRKIDMQSEEDYPNDAITAFLLLKDEDGESFPEDEIIDNLITLMFASHDTTTILLSLFIRHLARDPEVCKKVLEEQKEVEKEIEKGGNGSIGWNEIQSMKYTWRVAQEVMRITPPVFGNFKRVARDTTFDKFDIPKGWQVFWVTSPTHMDKNVFEEPDKFDPSRFENPSKTIPPYAYIPFGGGPRICPGVDFARIESLLIIHHLITNYEWTEIIPNEPLTREPLLYPSMGLPIKLLPRKTILAST